jgi:hypothetical protein
VTSVKVAGGDTYEGLVDNPTPFDDGWWIDDIAIDSTLVDPANYLVDNAANTALVGCGAGCTTVTPLLTVVSEQPTCDDGGDASALGAPCGNDAACVAIAGPGAECIRVVNPGTILVKAPGQVVELNALGSGNQSSADSCPTGTLQFQYEVDGQIVRQFTEDPVFIAAPLDTTLYEMTARCSTDPGCSASVEVLALVECPSLGTWFDWNMKAIDDPNGCGAFDWDTVAAATDRNPEIPGNYRVFRGELDDLLADGGFGQGDVVATNQSGTVFVDALQATPTTADCTGSGPSYYWLFARQENPPAGCNADGWTSGGVGEVDGKPWTPGTCRDVGGASDGLPCNFSSECAAVLGAGPDAYCRFITNRDDNLQGGGLPLP